MTKSTKYQEHERKAFAYYQQDGLLDLVAGAMVLALALNEITDTAIWTFGALMLIISYRALKNKITYPRIGFVKFKESQGGINRKMFGISMMIVLVLGVAGIVLLLGQDGAASDTRSLIQEGPSLLYGGLGLIGFSLIAMTTGLRRFFGYGLFAAIIFTAGHFVNFSLAISMFVMAFALMIGGGVLLRQFVAKYPISVEDNSDGS